LEAHDAVSGQFQLTHQAFDIPEYFNSSIAADAAGKIHGLLCCLPAAYWQS
jgi:hypothetical protein